MERLHIFYGKYVKHEYEKMYEHKEREKGQREPKQCLMFS